MQPTPCCTRAIVGDRAVPLFCLFCPFPMPRFSREPNCGTGSVVALFALTCTAMPEDVNDCNSWCVVQRTGVQSLRPPHHGTFHNQARTGR